MKRLPKKLAQQQAGLARNLQALAEVVEAAVDSYNEAVERAFDIYQSALADAYSEHIEPLDLEPVNEADAFRQEIVDQLQAHFDDRSEKWQEGDAGEQYQEWINTWEALDLDGEVGFDLPEPDAPDALDAPEIAWEEFAELPDSP